LGFENETESDTRANRIDPVLAASGWTTVPGAKVRREVICPGRIMPGVGGGHESRPWRQSDFSAGPFCSNRSKVT